MDALKIKYQNQVCTILCITHDFIEFTKQLEGKLKNSFFKGKEYFEAFFSFPFGLDEEQCKLLYSVCERNNTLILGFNETHSNDKLQLLQGSFYAGNVYELHENTVYIGNIEKDVKVISNRDLMVIGEVRGTVDMMFTQCEFSASSLNDAKIRIFDSQFQNLTNLAPCKVYYEDRIIKWA